MNTKMKTLLFGLFFAVSLGLKAQDKYEYATLIYTHFTGKVGQTFISIAKSNGTFHVITVPKEELTQNQGYYDFTPALKKIKEMNNEGWDVYNTTSEGVSVTFYLKRKE